MNEQDQTNKTARECRMIFEENRECPSSEALASFYQDDLAPEDTALVAAHLGGCAECARLIELLDEAEQPLTEDAAYRSDREEDRHQVARALGFRVGRPPARPLLERLSWLWETRVPALVPAAVCALLLAVILLPAPGESPVTVFNSPKPLISDDLNFRNADPRGNEFPVNTLITARHFFTGKKVSVGTMVNVEVTGAGGTEHFEPRTVTMSERGDGHEEFPCVEIPLRFNEPGSYQLKLSHPEKAFDPVVITIRVRA